MEKLTRFVAFVRTRYLSPRRRAGEGATIVEYSLLVALIAGLCIVVAGMFGKQVA